MQISGPPLLPTFGMAYRNQAHSATFSTSHWLTHWPLWTASGAGAAASMRSGQEATAQRCGAVAGRRAQRPRKRQAKATPQIDDRDCCSLVKPNWANQLNMCVASLFPSTKNCQELDRKRESIQDLVNVSRQREKRSNLRRLRLLTDITMSSFNPGGGGNLQWPIAGAMELVENGLRTAHEEKRDDAAPTKSHDGERRSQAVNSPTPFLNQPHA